MSIQLSTILPYTIHYLYKLTGCLTRVYNYPISHLILYTLFIYSQGGQPEYTTIYHPTQSCTLYILYIYTNRVASKKYIKLLYAFVLEPVRLLSILLWTPCIYIHIKALNTNYYLPCTHSLDYT